MANDELSKSKLYKAFETFGNLFALNIIFVVFSLPVITFGASITAMYSVAIKMVKNEEGAIWKSFVSAFKSNFKKATLIWLVLIVAAVVLFGEFLYIISFEGMMVSFYIVVLIVELVLIAFTLPFLFPLCARYENTVFNTIKNAFLLSVSNFGSWLKISLAWFAPIALTVIYPVIFLYTWYLWLFVIFALIAYGTSFTLRKVFNKIAITQEANEAREDEKKKQSGMTPSGKSIRERMEQFDKKNKED